MSRWSDGVQRVDGFLGRLVFRAVGLLCLIVAVGAGYGAWSQVAAGRPYGWTSVLLLGLIAVAFGSCVPFCFARKRTFAEALDAMEDSVPDMTRRPPADRPG